MNIEQLRAQIAALQDATMDENRNFLSGYHEGKFDALSAVDTLLDSLQEEPVKKLWHRGDEFKDIEYQRICKKVIGNMENKRFVIGDVMEVENGAIDLLYEDGCVAMCIRKEDTWAYIDDIIKLSNVQRTVKDCKEEPVSEELEEAMQHNAPDNIGIDDLLYWRNGFITGAKWQKETLWKSADGNDLPEIDREVIALLDNGKVVFAHRPPEFLDGKDIITGKVTRNYPKTYDKGGWNIPDVKYWLDARLPYEEDKIIK